MSGTMTFWGYWICCKCHRQMIPDDVDTCPTPSCKEKRCEQCPIDKLIVPAAIKSCNFTSQIPFKGSKIVLIILVASLQSLFTGPVAPEVLWWDCCKCGLKYIPKDEDACPDCKEKRCANCVEKRPIPRPTQ